MNIASDYSVTTNYSDYNAKTSQTSGESFTIPEKIEEVLKGNPILISSGQELSRTPPDYKTSDAFQQIDSQRECETEKEEEVEEKDNFLQKYVNEEEEEEDEEDGRLLDYFLKALKGEEEELRAEGNSYMSDEERRKFLMGRCPNVFAGLAEE